MKTKQHAGAVLALLALTGAVLGEDLQTYRQVKDWTPYFGGEQGSVYLSGNFEDSSVRLAPGRQVDWLESDVQLSLPLKNATPYVDLAYFERDHIGDYAFTAGSFFKLG